MKHCRHLIWFSCHGAIKGAHLVETLQINHTSPEFVFFFSAEGSLALAILKGFCIICDVLQRTAAIGQNLKNSEYTCETGEHLWRFSSCFFWTPSHPGTGWPTLPRHPHGEITKTKISLEELVSLFLFHKSGLFMFLQFSGCCWRQISSNRGIMR